MLALPGTLIAIGFLAFLIGTVWVAVTLLRRRGWEAPAIVTGLTVAVMNVGGVLASVMFSAMITRTIPIFIFTHQHPRRLLHIT